MSCLVFLELPNRLRCCCPEGSDLQRSWAAAKKINYLNTVHVQIPKCVVPAVRAPSAVVGRRMGRDAKDRASIDTIEDRR